MIPYEDLSRLLARELPPAEERALRERIRTEPDVALAWNTLQAAVADLADLDDPPPPAWLDAAVLATVPTVAEPRRFAGPWVAALVALAAAALVLVAPWGGGRTALVPATGTQLVTGPVDVVLPGGHLLLDGSARIDVEPPRGPVRALKGKEVAMDRSTLLAALAGAAVTVTVYEGKARFVADDGSATELVPGASHALGGAHAAPPPLPALRVPPAVPRAPDTTDAERIAELEAENGALRDALDQAELLHTVATGQLATYEGDPVPWPADVDPALRPDPFRDTVAKVAGEVGDVTVETVDCEEFPCIAVMSTPVKDDPMQIHELTRQFVDGMKQTFPEGTEPPDVVLMVSQVTDDDASRAILSFAYTDADDGSDTRTRFRAQRLVEEFEPTPPR
ncbi:MAG: hypothetical protein H6733_09940 [Alphaproteobacteria bacterium]|nr:hypothetical protein [Alphaproteobacteria bacterium]